MWAKCDMLVTVSFERLNKPYRRTRRSGRQYVEVTLSTQDVAAIDTCLRAYLQL